MIQMQEENKTLPTNCRQAALEAQVNEQQRHGKSSGEEQWEVETNTVSKLHAYRP